mmetsp:Transcript_71445/g.127464  ORF Transcript_71445/g.127464 Transcript_71445/m.127464 type:complete len:85 (+) Transcript_71445:340-594(+)
MVLSPLLDKLRMANLSRSKQALPTRHKIGTPMLVAKKRLFVPLAVPFEASLEQLAGSIFSGTMGAFSATGCPFAPLSAVGLSRC